jgi:hypothetical protein
MRLQTLSVLSVLALCAAGSAAAQVTTGVVVRGLSAGPRPPGVNPGDPLNPGRTCDFSREEVDHNNRMTGASVQCHANGNVGNTIPGLAVNFTAYCVVNANRVGGRVIAAAVPGNANHCDLSGITRAQATSNFGGAKWR